MPLSFLDDKGPGAADPGEPKDKKKEDHRQMLLVLASLVGVVIAWLTFKSIRGGASASGTPVSSASVPGGSSGQVLGSGGDTDAVNGFTSYLQNLSGEVTQLQNTINTQANSTSTLPATTPTSLGDPNLDPSNFRSYYVDYTAGPNSAGGQGGIFGITNTDQTVEFTPTEWKGLSSQGVVATTTYGAPTTPAKTT